MKKWLIVVMVSWFCPGCPQPAQAQDHLDIVVAVKAALQAKTVDLSGACGAFQITKRVAWALKTEQAGLLSKPLGNNCDGYSVDYIVYPDGRGFDILGDAGDANRPAWSGGDIDPAFVTRWRVAVDPGDTPNPSPLPSVEIVPHLLLIEQATAQTRQMLLEHETAEAAERAAAAKFRTDVGIQWSKVTTFIAKYGTIIAGSLLGGKLAGL